MPRLLYVGLSMKQHCRCCLSENLSVMVVQVISDNLATDQFLPAAHRSAINAAKQWMAQEWPRHFRLKPLTRERFLAPHVFLSGSNNNTSNAVHKREKHGEYCCAMLCDINLALSCPAFHCPPFHCPAPTHFFCWQLGLKLSSVAQPRCQWNLDP